MSVSYLESNQRIEVDRDFVVLQVRKAKLERKGISTINRQVLKVGEKGSV
jgi:hypothetical protein